MAFIRLTLLPITPNQPELLMDVLDTDFVFSNGQFQPVQVAPTITLMGVPVSYAITPFDTLQQAVAVTNQQLQEVKIIYRQPVDTSEYSDTSALVEPDPTNGMGVYGITLNETRITFAPVTIATS
jgi:hypothetical protein